MTPRDTPTDIVASPQPSSEPTCLPDTPSARFRSILVPPTSGVETPEAAEAPAFFHDLNLDQVVESITAGWRSYSLDPFFRAPLHDPEAIVYRQEVMRDFEDKEVMDAIKTFSKGMDEMRIRLPRDKEHHYPYHRERLLLEAVSAYCRTITRLNRDLSHLELASRGLRAFREYLYDYAASRQFQELASQTASLEADLSAITYCLLINGSRVTVRRCEEEADYSLIVERLFEKFRRDGTKDFHVKGDYVGGMNHIQAQVVQRVARLYPDLFRSLEAFYAEHTGFLDATVSQFDREVQFYVAYLMYIERFRRVGLHFCYPQVSATSKEVASRESFDIALADRLIQEDNTVVTNEFFLKGQERVFVVSGPNQGGKTTFARTFGQLHYLACLGCPVPGTEARLFLFDQIFTHFETQEHIETLRGKLKDDLVRIREILTRATPNSIIIMNEIFSSTTLKDAVCLGKKIMAGITDMDLLGVCVTFLDELPSLNAKTVSVVSMVDPSNPAIRTYKLRRRPADGLAYALAIADKHRVTYDWLKKRIKP